MSQTDKGTAIAALVEDMLRLAVVMPPPQRICRWPNGHADPIGGCSECRDDDGTNGKPLSYTDRVESWAQDLAGVARALYDAAEVRIDIELAQGGVIDSRPLSES